MPGSSPRRSWRPPTQRLPSGWRNGAQAQTQGRGGAADGRCRLSAGRRRSRCRRARPSEYWAAGSSAECWRLPRRGSDSGATSSARIPKARPSMSPPRRRSPTIRTLPALAAFGRVGRLRHLRVRERRRSPRWSGSPSSCRSGPGARALAVSQDRVAEKSFLPRSASPRPRLRRSTTGRRSTAPSARLACRRS